MTRAGRSRSVRSLTCPPARCLAVPGTRLARSVRARLPGTGTVLSCFRVIRIPAASEVPISAWVRLPARAVATASIGSGLTRSVLPGTGSPRPERPWSERPWSGWSWSRWSRSELLRGGRARSVVVRSQVVRPVLARAVLPRMLLLARSAPTVLGSASAMGGPLPPSAWSVPGAFPSRPAPGPATGIRPVGRGDVEPV